MRITEQNDLTEGDRRNNHNFAKGDRRKHHNFMLELNQRLRYLTCKIAETNEISPKITEIRPEMETVFLSRLPDARMGRKHKVMRDVSLGTLKISVEDRGVNTDVVEVKEKVKVKPKEKTKLELKPELDLEKKAEPKLKEIVEPKLKDNVITKDRGINTQIMGQIVAGN